MSMKNMYVLLIHGTWAGGGRWTHAGSKFRTRLASGLKDIGYEPRFETFPWNGANRWRARVTVAKELNEHLDRVASERDKAWEFLVVAHSHGGNIATEAVRNRLRKQPELPIRGIACLNTPFLTHEVRGSSAYLFVWLLLAIALGAAFFATGGLERNNDLPNEVLAIAHYQTGIFTRANLFTALIAISGIVALLLALSKRLQAHQQDFAWGPRPNVLCLSCPDDEAITFLGLGEGISNLPQLLLHPLALALFVVVGLFVLRTSGGLTWCADVTTCWNKQVATISTLFLLWMVLALLGGILGSLSVALLFGLSPKQTFETLVSRVLVSYAPLRPAQSYFRGISELSLKWGSPLQLFHSRIYESPQTPKEICEWLRDHTLPLQNSHHSTPSRTT